MEKRLLPRLLIVSLGLAWLCGCQAVNSLSTMSQRRGLPAQHESAEVDW